MGLRRITKKTLKYLVPTLLVLFMVPLGDPGKKEDDPEAIFGDGPIRCALKMDDRLSDGFLSGYCYEMLERFALHAGESAEIFLAEPTGSCLDSIRDGNLDILALSSSSIESSDDFTTLPLGDTPIVWIMKNDRKEQREIIRWLNRFKGTNDYSGMLSRFFHGYNPYRKGVKRDPMIISPYDELIKENALKIGWDWKMFAALVWCESRFRIQARSPRGALGLMQMMPRTADRYEIEDLLNPKENIEAGAEYIKRLQSKFRDTAADNEELVKFTLAAYNAGEGRIYDCIKLARSQGIDTGTWDNLCTVLPQMSLDSVLLAGDLTHGKFKGKETIAYVKAVLNQYDIFCGNSPRYKVQPTDTALVKMEETEAIEDILLSPDSLGRIDPGDEQTWDQEENHNDKPGGDISGKHRGKIQMDRDKRHKIVFGVQFDGMGPFLDTTQSQRNSIADQHSAKDYDGGYVQKDLRYSFVGHPQGFKRADCRDVPEKHYKEAGNHVEAGHNCHQHQDEQDIEVDKVKPVENLRVAA